MALQVSQNIVQAGTTPAAITAASSDTIADGSFGPTGVICRIITTGTGSNVTITDPGTTALNNAGTPAVLAAPATGVRMMLIPRAAINPATGLATINFSSITGLTYELYRF